MSDKKYSVNFATAKENLSCGGGGGDSESLSRTTLTVINAAITGARSRKRHAPTRRPSQSRASALHRDRFISRVLT
jgi:hypothetical protein